MRNELSAAAVQRFVVEQIRDTKLNLLRRPPAATMVRPHFGERIHLWWMSTGGSAHLAHLEALARRYARVWR